MLRRVESEWLDTLSADDPRAQRSRRDLRRVNACMRNAHIVADALVHMFRAATPRHFAEIGAGDGYFMLALAQRLAPKWPRLEVSLVDRQDSASAQALSELRALQWHVEPSVMDAFEWLEHRHDICDVLVANLFLHHFDGVALRRLLQLSARRTRIFIACEPRRASLPLAASRLLGLIGCNDVSRHDAVASVRAGFDGSELSRLWPDRGRWQLEEQARGLFSHFFIACRHGE